MGGAHVKCSCVGCSVGNVGYLNVFSGPRAEYRQQRGNTPPLAEEEAVLLMLWGSEQQRPHYKKSNNCNTKCFAAESTDQEMEQQAKATDARVLQHAQVCDVWTCIHVVSSQQLSYSQKEINTSLVLNHDKRVYSVCSCWPVRVTNINLNTRELFLLRCAS